MLNDVGKRRIGLIIPSINVRMEPELYRLGELHDFNIYTTRIKLNSVTEENLKAMEQDVRHAAEMLCDVNPEIIIFGCTSGSFISHGSGSRDIGKEIESICKCPVVTASDALIAALQALETKKLTLVTAYTDDINEKEKAYIESFGIEVVSMTGLGITIPEQLWSQSVETIENLVLAADTPEADTVFISCTNLEGFHICGNLEKLLNKPVFSSNLACLWRALSLIEHDVVINDRGILFQKS